MLVLSLFPGADLLGTAFRLEGFCVVQGPEKMMGGDIHDFIGEFGKFDGVIGGPPCQTFSQAVIGQESSEGNLIPEFERVVAECKPKFWVMENVKEAPIPKLAVWNEVLDAWEFGTNQTRKRRFSSNLNLTDYIVKLPLEERCKDPFPTITATEYKFSPGKTGNRRAGRKLGRVLTLDEIKELMDLPIDFDTPCLLKSHKYKVLGNGVPIKLGRAVAAAVKECLNA